MAFFLFQNAETPKNTEVQSQILSTEAKEAQNLAEAIKAQREFLALKALESEYKSARSYLLPLNAAIQKVRALKSEKDLSIDWEDKPEDIFSETMEGTQFDVWTILNMDEEIGITSEEWSDFGLTTAEGTQFLQENWRKIKEGAENEFFANEIAKMAKNFTETYERKLDNTKNTFDNAKSKVSDYVFPSEEKSLEDMTNYKGKIIDYSFSAEENFIDGYEKTLPEKYKMDKYDELSKKSSGQTLYARAYSLAFDEYSSKIIKARNFINTPLKKAQNFNGKYTELINKNRSR